MEVHAQASITSWHALTTTVALSPRQVFTESTHIVAVKTSGNVYCYQALEELNFKPKNLRRASASPSRHCHLL